MQTEQDGREVSAILANEIGSTYRLILSGAGSLPVAGAKTVTLSEVVEFEASGPEFRCVADLRDVVGAQRKKLGGAPNRFGEALTALIERRISCGKALVGRNEEARAVLSEFIRENPTLTPPSFSSVQNYVTKVRTGQ